VDAVTIRDLRNHGGDVVARIERGERLVVTRDGRPVAELVPLPGPGVTRAELIRRRRTLPVVDPSALQRDIDAVVDAAL